ncbi:MAG: thioredoxin domain-containing protein [Pyrinomonadaceae bacterium]
MSEQKFTNRLINETSPYLQQHAHNPVEWYAWGEEAFTKARAEDKPILLSVGYSSCHWCHVMEHESFENEEIANLMNEKFINLKVDKEERPDVDQIYMNFIQLTSGHGGHPMTVFLTPEGIPFFGGTYFPPVRRYNMPSFPEILESVSAGYRTRREEIETSVVGILGELRRIGLAEASNLSLSNEQLDSAFRVIAKSYDRTNGGFGGAPKFPAPMTLEFCLKYWARTRDKNALEIVANSCRQMAMGGIYDQLGGGFHRYTVDANWLTPHFEKMLYDNAQLAKIYLHVWQATQDPFFRQIAIDTLEYIAREMTDEQGGFYSATDADSEGEEGKFFIWTPAEIKEILGAEDAKIFNYHFDVSETGNFEAHNILNVRQSNAESAEQLNISVEKLTEVLERGKNLLYEKRANRVPPFRDEKVLTAWNGLMLAAFAEAGAILENPEFIATATKNADFVLSNLIDEDGFLLRSWKDGTAKIRAFVEDYANYADGLIELYQATGELRWLTAAKNLTDQMLAEFWDEEDGGFFFASKSAEELIIRSKDYFDNATPSGNSVALDVLLKLAVLTGDENYHAHATALFRLMNNFMRRYPQAFGRALSAFDFYLNSIKEIVVIGANNPDRAALLQTVYSRYISNKIVVVSDESDHEAAEIVQLLQERTMIDGHATVYLCENFTCQQPVTTAEDLMRQLYGAETQSDKFA